MIRNEFSFLDSSFNPLINFLIRIVPSGIIMVVLSVALLFGSILFFRKVLTDLLGFGSQERFRRFFFRSPLKSFAWGVVATAAIRSSTVTTSLVVPLVARKTVKRKAAIPFVLGANVGTTITAFIAALVNSNAAISIAIAHFLFNVIGVLIFSFVPYVKDVPGDLARGLGRLVFRSRFVGFLYLSVIFFVIPFSLIYFNRHTAVVRKLTYVHRDVLHQKPAFDDVLEKTQEVENTVGNIVRADSGRVISVYRKKNQLLRDNELFEFNSIGSCRQGPGVRERDTLCVRGIRPRMIVQVGLLFDSVYIFEKRAAPSAGSVWYYICKSENLLVRTEKRDKTGNIISSDELVKVGKK